jgi:predicted NBD/HSP70 family sugar kinase
MADEREVKLVSLAHARPGLTRAQAVREVGLSSGRAVDLVARLDALRLLAERPAEGSGRRGRPTTELVAHPDGPLVAAVSLRHDLWQACVAELGGAIVAEASGEHDAAQEPTLRAMAGALRGFRRRFGPRIAAVVVAAPGVIRGGVVLQASNLGWRDVDLRPLWPRPAVPVVAGNDATFAGWAERIRGAARGYASALHLHVDSGLGGVNLAADSPAPIDTDLAGEFGHMPFGNPRLACECGASGCWDLMVDGRALARELGAAEPRDPARYLTSRLADPAARRALGALARALGRGAAGLVNALDPAVVTLGGSAAELLATRPDAFRRAYLGGLMAFRRDAPVPVVPAALGDDGSLIGAVEVGFARVLTRSGVDAWRGRCGGAGV